MLMKRSSLRLLRVNVLALVITQGFTSASVAQSHIPDVSFSGYGTLGYAVLDDPNAEYRTSRAIDGADDSGSFEVDTRLGLQMDVVFNPKFSSTFQLTAREAVDGDPAIELEWGFLRWLPTDSIAVRVGRMSLPVYSSSDSREVGYASPYLRLPEDLYSTVPLRRFGGVDVTIDHQLGESLLSWQFLVGQSREEIFDDLTPDLELAVGFSFSIETGPARIRFNHLGGDVDIDSDNVDISNVRNGIAAVLQTITPEQLAAIDPSFGSLTQQEYAQVAPALEPLVSDFAGKRVSSTFDSVALTLEFSRVFIDAEYTRRRVDNWVSDVDGWALALGTRIGRFQPYAHVSVLSEKQVDRRIDLPGESLLELGINAFYEPRDQRTIGIGARYDLSANVAIKAQIDEISREVMGISFIRSSEDDGSDEGEDVTLFSVVLDVVF